MDSRVWVGRLVIAAALVLCLIGPRVSPGHAGPEAPRASPSASGRPPAPAPSPVQPPGTYLLRYSDRVGDRATYSMVMQGSSSRLSRKGIERTETRAELALSQRVVAAQGDLVTIRTKVESGSTTTNGKASPVPFVGQESDTQIRRDGAVVKTSGFAGLDLQNMQIVVPDTPVAVDSTWRQQLPASAECPVPMEARYQVVAAQALKGQECLKISLSVRPSGPSTVDGVSMDVKADGTVFFAPKAGRILLNEVKSSTKTTMRRTVNDQNQHVVWQMNMHMRLELLD